MSFAHSQLIKFKISPNLKLSIKAELFYPKLVLFEDSVSFRIVDLKSELIEENSVDEDILDKMLLDGLLWLVLKSGNIVVLDLISSLKMKIVTNLKINLIRLLKNNVLFLSESGEYYEVPFMKKELVEKLEEGISEIVVNLTKVYHTKENPGRSVMIDRFNVSIESGKLKCACAITGSEYTIDSELVFDHVLPWEENLLLSDRSNMFVVDLKEYKIVYRFENILSNYYPVAVSDGCLYYLVWDKEEVQVCWAWIASLLGENNEKHPSNNSNQTHSSQETLINQLRCLVDSALTDAKDPNITAQLQGLYDKINDYGLLIETSLKLCKHNLLYKPLLFPLQKRVHLSGKRDLIEMLSDLIIKIDLLEYILFKRNSSYENNSLFEKNFKELCVMFISKSDLDLASICWLKYFEMKVELTSEAILDILNAIPHNTKMGSILIWMRNFLPPLLEQNPFHIDLFVKWTEDRVFKLEQSGYWPKIGIKYLEEIIKVLETSSKTITIRPISMDDLDKLKNHIIYILELKENYKINMLLSEITSQSPHEVALIMLRRCYTEDLEAFLQDYLPAYATRHLMDIDDVLRAFIKNDIASCGGQVDGIRLTFLLNAFHSLTSRLECLLQVLKVLDVPWNPTVLHLAIDAAASSTKDFTVSDADHILAQEIQNELMYAKVKAVLKKYNFPLTSTDYKLILHKLVNASVVDLNDLKVITSVMVSVANYGNALYINRCLQDCETRMALNYFNELSKKEKNILLKTIIAKYEQIISKTKNNNLVERNYLDFIKGTQCIKEIQMRDLEHLYHHKNNKNINIKHEYQPRDLELLELLRQTSITHQVRRFVSKIILSVPNTTTQTHENEPTTVCVFKDGQNSTLLVESWKVLIELIEKCKEEHLHVLLKQVSELNALINTTIVVKNLSIAWKFHYVHMPISSATSVNELIDFYSKNQVLNVSTSEDLNISKYDFILFRIISNVLTNVNNNTECTALLSLKKKAAKRLLTQIIASHNIDEVFLTSLLLTLKTEEEVNDKLWVLEALQGQNENMTPAIICYLSSPSMRQTFELDTDAIGNSVSHPPHYILKSKFNINLSEIAIPENTEETWDVKVILFYVLKQYPVTSFDKLLEFCRALNILPSDGLSLQLISLLSNWNLNYKFFDDELGRRQMIVEDDENNIYNTCLTIWESIEKKDILRDILNDFWKNGEITFHGRVISINPYYYEVFLCIYRLIFGASMELRNIKEYFLLHFLKEYRRKSSPKQYEFELFLDKGMFPEIGHFRLPFHLFMRDDKWANLKSEITLETYERWLPAVAILCLDTDPQTAKDMICSNALKQTMTSRRRNEDENSNTEPWHLTTREEPLLRAAHRCVRHIENMEWAGACLFYLLQGCIRGADQVAAAQLCFQFAQRWAALQPGNRAVPQMERLYATLSTRHALYKIDWACDQLLRLSNESAQLIRALYLHPDFIKKINRHDVNRAANEIADKNGINISSIKIQILENILDKSKEDTKNKDFTALNTTELLTAKYILKASPKIGAIYLSRIAFDDETDYNKGKKLRALQCLMSVVEPDTALKVTNQNRDALWLSLLELLCVVKLENIDMPWVAVTFLQDKECALKQLLQSVEGNNKGIRIVAELACRYGSPEIIHSIIPVLLNVGLYEEMIPLLLKVSSPLDGVLCTAWRAVILSPFQRADYPITDRQRAKCLNAINLLPICPVIKDEDLIEIWKHCVRCKCLGLGCLLLPYMSPETRKSLNELLKIDRRNLIVSLKNLQSETYLVSGAMYVIENMTLRSYR